MPLCDWGIVAGIQRSTNLASRLGQVRLDARLIIAVLITVLLFPCQFPVREVGWQEGIV